MRVTLAVILLILSGCSGRTTAILDVAEQQPPEKMTGEASPASESSVNLLPGGPTEEDFPHLRNLLKITERIYSGGEPQNEQAFAELAMLGVRTVVSVDGARPKLDLAERFGLRYVHIPIGYDGVSDGAGKQLSRLVQEADGPFYIHCHHGRHRGPAAAAVASIADGAADGESALVILEKAGTSKNYGRLWRDVEAFTRPASDDDPPKLVSVAEVGSLAAGMAQIDRASDHLQLFAADWQAPADHPDISPPQEALLLKEGFRETVRRLKQANDYDDRFLTWMKQAEQTATRLESALNAGNTAAANSTFSKVQNQCKRCHNQYRN